jgi:hypothetical protein
MVLAKRSCAAWSAMNSGVFILRQQRPQRLRVLARGEPDDDVVLAITRTDQEGTAGGVVVDVGHIGERDPGRAAESEPGAFALEREHPLIDDDPALTPEPKSVVERLVGARRLTGGEVHAEFFQMMVPANGFVAPAGERGEENSRSFPHFPDPAPPTISPP